MRPFSTGPVQGDVVRARLDALISELGPASTEPAGSEERDETTPSPRRALPAREPPRVLRRAWEFGRAHAAVIGVVGLVALLGAVWTLNQARTVPIAVAAPTPVAPSATPAAGSEPSPTPTPVLLRVHVLGAVAAPGVVRLPPGARVEDAIAAAGGLTAEARPGELNLAAPIADGAQVVVGSAGKPGGEVRGAPETGSSPSGAGAATGGGARLDLNRATLAELDALPGVGPVTAQAILAWREQHQRFNRVEELLEIDGIGAKTLERIEPHVRV